MTPSQRIQSLWVSLLLVLATFVSPAQAFWPFSSADPEPVLAERTAELLSRMIQIPTPNPPGHEAPLARLLVETLKAEGIDAS